MQFTKVLLAGYCILVSNELYGQNLSPIIAYDEPAYIIIDNGNYYDINHNRLTKAEVRKTLGKTPIAQKLFVVGRVQHFVGYGIQLLGVFVLSNTLFAQQPSQLVSFNNGLALGAALTIGGILLSNNAKSIKENAIEKYNKSLDVEIEYDEPKSLINID